MDIEDFLGQDIDLARLRSETYGDVRDAVEALGIPEDSPALRSGRGADGRRSGGQWPHARPVPRMAHAPASVGSRSGSLSSPARRTASASS